ncbi:hypothetical protein HCUR_01576 [Holospora curviuscula]|uniref:Uncharacterized protein n=2 Tax=Holospora curviuscula TaxID=1082868 RepID=A0A2S5R794_9PROT|nr:hypothetical protein HCUR_01576 [Holospora curviuscula]
MESMIIPSTSDPSCSTSFMSRWSYQETDKYEVMCDEVLTINDLITGFAPFRSCNRAFDVFLGLRSKDQKEVLINAWQEISQKIEQFPEEGPRQEGTFYEKTIREKALLMKEPIFNLFNYFAAQKGTSIKKLQEKLAKRMVQEFPHTNELAELKSLEKCFSDAILTALEKLKAAEAQEKHMEADTPYTNSLKEQLEGLKL